MNRNLSQSTEENRIPDLETPNADIIRYLSDGVSTTVANTVQNGFIFMRRQLDDIFELFNEAIIKVWRIETPSNVGISLLPFDDSLKNLILNDFSNDYYFVLKKSDFADIDNSTTLFDVKIAQDSNNFYYIQLLQGKFDLIDGGGEDAATSGVRIPNPPKNG